MKNLCIATLFCWIAGPAVAQNPKINSLNRLLTKATTDTGRVNLNVWKAKELFSINLDSALMLATRTVAIAKKIAYPTGEANALLEVTRTQTFKGNFTDARTALHRAEALFSAQNETKAFDRLYSRHGVLHLMQNQVDSAVFFSRKPFPLRSEPTTLNS